MHLRYTRPLDQLAHVPFPHAAARYDFDPSTCAINQLGYHVRSFQRGGCCAGRQDAVDSNLDELFERAPRVRHGIERAMERDWKACGCLNESPRFCDGEAALCRQRTRDNARRSEVASSLDILEDRLDLFHRVDKVPRAGSHQNKDRNFDPGGDRRDQVRGWGRPALIEVYAELDASDAAALRG